MLVLIECNAYIYLALKYMAYYYKNEIEKDTIVSVDAMLDFFERSQTPSDKKLNMPMPNVASHAIVSSIQSKDVEGVKTATIQYLEEVLGLMPNPSSVK